MKPALRTLITDLYQLTMAAGYWENKMHYPSTFELFVRKLPKNRSFMVAAGLEQCIKYLASLKFMPEEIEFLKKHPVFKNVSADFFKYLEKFRFTGDVWAIEEGNIYFPNEPVIRVTAPLIEAQLVETYLLSMFNFQSLIASKAARMIEASGGRGVVEFGSRRAHSPDASVLGARAAYIGGCVGTSNVMAGLKYGIPVYGTMAHSWVMSFDTEKEAYEAYNKVFPDSTVLLIDTYDTVKSAKMLAKLPMKVTAVRLDSGDIAQLSKEVRQILDRAGRMEIKILGSGDLNEYLIKKMVDEGCPIDIFGVGTDLATSKDAPALSGVYKLVEQNINEEIHYRAKFSEDKATYPSKKQVYRYLDEKYYFNRDIIMEENEIPDPGGIPLLKLAIKAGKIVKTYHMNINEARNLLRDCLYKLPEQYRKLESTEIYPVKFSEKLETLRNEVKEKRENLSQSRG